MYLWKLLGYGIEQKDNEGYQNIQKAINNKKEYYTNVKENFTELKNYLSDWHKKINILNNKFLEFNENKDTTETIKLIYDIINNIIKSDINLIDNIIANLNENIENFIEEIKIYKEFKTARKKLMEEKFNLFKYEEDFQKIGKNSEKYIINYIQNNKNNINNILKDNSDLINIGNQYKKSFNNYNNTVIKVQDLIKDYNNKQNKLYDYLPQLANKNENFIRNINNLIKINLIKEEEQLILNKKKLKEIDDFEINSELKEILKEIKKLKKEEKDVKIIKYKTEIEFNKCKDDEEFFLFAKSAMAINKYLDENLFKNFDEEKEKKKFQVVKFIKDLFEDKISIDEKTSDLLLEKLKNKSVHKVFYIILSSLRTNKYQKSKVLIELLGKGFNYLLSHVNKDDIYEYVKNCIIISQTYYYMDEQNNKIYLIKFIKNIEYLKNSYFWREYIKFGIEQELNRLKKLYNIESEKDSLIKLNEINEIVFSQILSCINNMFEFEVDKRIIVKIVDEQINYYNCLSESHLENIYGIISSDKSEIKQLRNDYSPSLESEPFIIKEDNEYNEDNLKNNENNKDNQIETQNSIKHNNQIKEKDDVKKNNTNQEDIIIDQELLDMINNEENDF